MIQASNNTNSTIILQVGRQTSAEKYDPTVALKAAKARCAGVAKLHMCMDIKRGGRVLLTEIQSARIAR